MRGISTRAAAIAALCGGIAAAQTAADGIAAFRQGRYAESRRILEKLASPDATARTFLALSRAATGDCAAARPDLERQFANRNGGTLERLAGIALVQCDLAAHRTAEIWPVLERLQQEFPADGDVLYEAAKAHRQAWDDAVFQLHQKAPGSYRVNQMSGEIFEIEGHYAEAAAEYRKAIQKNPAALNLHFRLGRALLLASHEPASLTAARREFEAELALNPSDAAAEYEIGRILEAGQDAGAAAHFARAVALDPNFAEALIALARTKSSARQYGEAIGLLERAVKIEPESEAAHYALMMAYRNAGRSAEAQREKAIFDKLNRPPEGEFTEFLKKLGEKAPKQ